MVDGLVWFVGQERFPILGIVCEFVSASVPDPTQSSPEYIIFVFSKDLSLWSLETRLAFSTVVSISAHN